MIRLFVKLLPTTLRARLLIYLIGECCRYGEIDSVNYSCKFMTLYWYNTLKNKKIEFSLSYSGGYEFRLTSRLGDNSSSLTA